MVGKKKISEDRSLYRQLILASRNQKLCQLSILPSKFDTITLSYIHEMYYNEGIVLFNFKFRKDCYSSFKIQFRVF